MALALNGSRTEDIARVLHVSPGTVIQEALWCVLEVDAVDYKGAYLLLLSVSLPSKEFTRDSPNAVEITRPSRHNWP